MRPENLKTSVFLDSGDPAETKEILELLGFLDGQTTNPSLIAKNPEAQAKIAAGEKFSEQEVQDFYKGIVGEIEGLLGSEASISIEVVADHETPAESIVGQAHEMMTWVAHPHIKIPITHEGLKAGEQLVGEGVHLNYTLNFSQEQAAAVHAASRGAATEQVYISPFRGRLDDSGVAGAEIIEYISQMYRQVDSPVEVLVASVRDYESFLYAIYRGRDIVTVPGKILREWAKNGLEIPTEMADPVYADDVADIPVQELDLSGSWEDFNIAHYKTDEGLLKFMGDWMDMVDVK